MTEDETNFAMAIILLACLFLFALILASLTITYLNYSYESCIQVAETSVWNQSIDICEGYRMY